MARVFTRGGWGILALPLLVAAVLVWLTFGVGEPSKETESPDTSAVAVLVPTFERLPPAATVHYELWEHRPDDGEARIGAFRVLEGGGLVDMAGETVSGWPLADPPLPGTEYLVTVEPEDSLADTRGERVLLRGQLKTTEAQLTFALPALPPKGSAVLGSPTSTKAPETAGVWLASAWRGDLPVTRGSALPVSPVGWTYALWVVTGADTTLLAGRFTDPARADEDALYGETAQKPTLPGEDFLQRAPDNATFPLNLADGKTHVLVSLESTRAESPDRPYLTIVRGRIRYQQAVHTAFSLAVVDDVIPSGTIRIEQRAPANGRSE